LATHMGDGRPLDGQSLRAIALHEIGHLIGLAHSDDGHDVMAPLVRVTALSAADRATARLLYTLPAGHLR
jgi:predicted Zn-dependent protease